MQDPMTHTSQGHIYKEQAQPMEDRFGYNKMAVMQYGTIGTPTIG